MSTDECKAVREKTGIEQEIDRIMQTTDTVRMLRNKMVSINSKMLGDLPDKVQGETADRPCRTGMIGALQDVVDTNKEEISDLETAIRRLEDSGVV